jgi:CubicO group peptidase (beta-lactamase class C family)
MDVTGRVASGFECVAEVFEENFASRGEVGAGVAVMAGDELVVDLYGGVTEPGGAPYSDTTLQMVASATKGAMALCVLRLVDQGKVDLEATMATYWPEFAAAGKDRVTVREALAHRAGVPYFDGGLTVEDIVAWHPAAEKLAAQARAWEPGTDHGYHAITHAWLVGELIRRVTGQLPGDYLAAEICAPLGLDLYVGLPASEHPRVAPMILPVPQPEPDEFSVRMLTAGSMTFRSFFIGEGLLGWLNLPELWSETPYARSPKDQTGSPVTKPATGAASSSPSRSARCPGAGRSGTTGSAVRPASRTATGVSPSATRSIRWARRRLRTRDRSPWSMLR